MRIVAGEFKGRTLAPVPRRGVRPTADPVREALFNILGAGVRGEAFVDLAAGTGAVGLEAYSRGARPVVLVENDRQAAETIRRNVERLGLDSRGSEGLTLAVAEAGQWLRGAARDLLPRRVGIFFLDPPYGEPRLARWIEAIAEGGWLDDESLVIVEHRTGGSVAWGPVSARWSRRYGDSTLSAGGLPAPSSDEQA
jgi:16S rRNA (guanine(966)-N(2))-methyltransferase RsmD